MEVDVEYKCGFCGAGATIPVPGSASDVEYPYSPCHKCGCFMIPKHLSPGAKPLEKYLFERFSRCPNAHECSMWDQYDAECERGVVMPKCFKSLHDRLDIMDHYLIDPLVEKARLRSLREHKKKQESDDR